MSRKQARQEAIQQAKARREELTQQARQACIKARREALQSMDVGQANNWKTSIENPGKSITALLSAAWPDHEQGVKKIERDIHEAQKALDNSRTEQERAERH